MRLPKPYFKNIDNLGSLDVDYIIFEAEYPVLFTCIDKFNELYLCLCCDIRKEQRWIISKTTSKIVKELLHDKITLYNAFKSPYGINYTIIWSYEEQVEKVNKVDFDDIDDLDLPVKDEYLEAEEDEFKEYILLLTKREEETNIIISDLTDLVKTIDVTLKEMSTIQEKKITRKRTKYNNTDWFNTDDIDQQYYIKHIFSGESIIKHIDKSELNLGIMPIICEYTLNNQYRN